MMKSHLTAGDPARSRFSRRVGGITMSATKQMPIIAARVGGCVSLGQGVPSFATPAHVAEAVRRALAEDPATGKYSLQPGMPELRRAVSADLRAEKELEYDPDTEIAVTVGAMGALADAFLTLVDPGDEVIVPEPAYASYIEQIHLCEGIPVFVPLRSRDWGLDVDAVRAAVTPRTRAVVVCNPSNPTGGVFSAEDLAAVTECAIRHDFFVITDETYDYLVYDRPAPASPGRFPGARDRVIVINSFSKKYALTGWRVGYVAAAAPVMEQIMKVHDATAICAPTPGQYAALAALTGPRDMVRAMTAALRRRRDLAVARMERLHPAFDFVAPAGAFYLMARYRFTSMPSLELAVRLIEEARVVTVPGSSFGPHGEGHLRISFGGDEREIDQAFDRIEEWVKRHG